MLIYSLIHSHLLTMPLVLRVDTECPQIPVGQLRVKVIESDEDFFPAAHDARPLSDQAAEPGAEAERVRSGAEPNTIVPERKAEPGNRRRVGQSESSS